MGWGMSTSFNFKSIQDLHDQFNERLQEGFDQAAQKLAADAAGAAPVETGALALSVYVSTPKVNTYADAKAAVDQSAAESANNRDLGTYRALPEIKPTSLPGATVGVAASHGAPINFGFTHNRTGQHIPAVPFWTDAVEHSRRELQDILLTAFRGGIAFGPGKGGGRP